LVRLGYWSYLLRANAAVDLMNAWGRVPPSLICRELSLRFEKASVVFVDDNSQMLYDRLRQIEIWADAPSSRSEYYDITGIGSVHVECVSNIKARRNFSVRSEESALVNEVAAEASARIKEASVKFDDMLSHVSPAQFEMLVADILSRLGLRTVITRGSHDDGVDIFAILYDGARAAATSTTIIQCKMSKRTVGVQVLREFAGAKLLHNAEHGVLVTTSQFSRRARELVRDHAYFGIELADLESLREWWLASFGYRTVPD
jgi:HJR/Mrr/RecB family endonuclease